MAVTVISRPLGHKLSTTDIAASIINDGSGVALVYTGSAHGLSDGDYVYIESNFESYNGFKYVDSIAYDSFKIKHSIGGDYVNFKQTTSITFRISVLDHGWQCVHLPIVYKLQSNIFPLNNLNTARTVSSFTNENGYTNLNLSGGIVAINTLSYLVITGASSDALNGVFQIINKITVSDVTIDLAYDAGYDFLGAKVIKYYKNYFVTVKVYGGLDAGHPWYEEKPMELLVTLKFTPDSLNNIKFSISEILKGQITLRNNLTLDTLPNNIDFFTSFYITYIENYDTSDGLTVSVFTDSEAIDTFTGYATNSILPFKSESISHLSDYVNAGDYLARWLTVQDRPQAYQDRFFDLSFVNRVEGDLQIEIIKSYEGIVSNTDYLTINNPGLGIIRVPVTADAVSDQFCITAFLLYAPKISPLSLANNYGTGEAWTTGSTPTIAGITTGEITKILRVPISQTLSGGTINFSVDLDINNISGSGGTFNSKPLFYLHNDDMSESISIGGGDIGGVYISAGNRIETHELTPSFVPAFLSMTFEYTGSGGFVIGFDINSITIISSDTLAITEKICIDISGECDGTFTSDNLRITEGGLFRELE